MGNCVSLPSPLANLSKKNSTTLPIQTTFKLPSPIPNFTPGGGFANGTVDLGGGLHVCQISSFTKIWATHEGGPDNLGATFFEPSPIPAGFSMLGCYSQPNNKPLYGWVLVGKDDHTTTGGALAKPIDYSLIWSSKSLKIKQDGIGYIWLPTPPDGYKAVGHVVTLTPEKPSVDKIKCVRSDLTDQCEMDTWIWGQDKTSNADGFNVYNSRPSNRGTQAHGVSVGTFVTQNGRVDQLSCLKNTTTFSFMPNLEQIKAIVQAYSPLVYFHPDEKYLPSTVSWFFTHGALLYTKEGKEPVKIEPTGSNLPLGGSNDDAYWLDLPANDEAKEFVKKGDLQTSGAYLHVKPMLGGTFTDVAIWVFYPFNGPARAKIEFLNIPLGKIGQHVCDWEHVTLRISNFNGQLWSIYFSEHSGGTWVNASELEFQNGTNKSVAYASLHGHAFYPKPGIVLQGNGRIGIRNDTAKSKMVMDTGVRFSVVAAEYLGVVEPPWLNYLRKWGPKISYDLDAEINNLEKLLPGKVKSAFDKFVKSLPDEVLGEEGPTGPKVKNNWNGDEV